MRKEKLFLTGTVMISFFLVILVGTGVGPALAEEETGLTIYQSGPSLLVDRQEITLTEGTNNFSKEVPSQIIEKTIFATSPAGSLESVRFNPGVGSESALLEELVGRVISVTKSGYPDYSVKGTLVAIVDGKPLLRTTEGELRWVRSPNEYRFDGMSSEELSPRLEIIWLAEEEVETELTLGYQLSGLSWSPEYVAFVDQEAKELSLRGVAHLTNETDKDFQEVKVQLVAGEPEREEEGRFFAMARAVDQPEMIEPEAVFEYYRYSLGDIRYLARGEKTQIPFLWKDSVDYERYYRFEPATSSAVRTIFELSNRTEKGLGTPLASGTVRVYEGLEDKVFLGESKIPGLPVGDEADLELGDAFDLQGERKRLDHEKLGERLWRDEVEVTLKNRKSESVRIDVIENLPGSWEILRSSHEYEKLDVNRIKYRVSVPAGESVTVNYLVEYGY